jgi:hypothetical protein
MLREHLSIHTFSHVLASAQHVVQSLSVDPIILAAKTKKKTLQIVA